MKKMFIAAITISFLIFSGCQSAGKEDPKEVLHSFLTAMSQKDFTKAKTLATQDSDGMISMMEMGMQSMQNGNGNDHADKMMELVNNMKIGSAVVDGDKASVSVTDSKSNESTDFQLKKEKGDWKVAFDMTTLTDMANKKMKDHGMDMNSPEIREKMDSAMQNMHKRQSDGSTNDSQ
ncbi:MAG: hypothetical protein ABI366_04115 [Ginsengibacter sp.]